MRISSSRWVRYARASGHHGEEPGRAPGPIPDASACPQSMSQLGLSATAELQRYFADWEGRVLGEVMCPLAVSAVILSWKNMAEDMLGHNFSSITRDNGFTPIRRSLARSGGNAPPTPPGRVVPSAGHCPPAICSGMCSRLVCLATCPSVPGSVAERIRSLCAEQQLRLARPRGYGYAPFRPGAFSRHRLAELHA